MNVCVQEPTALAHCVRGSRGFKFSKRPHSLDQRDPDPPDLREVKLRSSDRTRGLKSDCIRVLAGDPPRESFDAFFEFCGQG